MTGRTVQAIRHVGFEDLGSFEAPLKAAGYVIQYIDVGEYDPGSLDPLGADLLVVLGGPIGVHDRTDYPFVTGEIEMLRVRLAADLPTLGICLGAQLMAAALNAQVYPAPEKEIGWSEINLRETGGLNPLAALTGTSVFHWHSDTFDLPAGTTLLASTEVCSNQAFSRGPNVLGLQFHPEVVGTRFEYWLLGHASELKTAGISPAALRDDARRHAHRLQQASAELLANWLFRLKR
ncbi:glutamine amidotransferase [Brucella pituitosa]|uniref:glutamine amidotransferase n=1 Tax=Brucella pituitosa TaxID=571256 RepID=UPI003C78D554